MARTGALSILLCVATVSLAPIRAAISADTETPLHVFRLRHDGGFPGAGLVRDAAGNMYGTTADGVHTFGTVYELSPAAKGGWTFKIIYTVQDTVDGALPESQLALDSNGNIYGTTVTGGANSQGAVFELSQDKRGHWYLSNSYDFAGTYDGGHPQSGVVVDKAGHVFGMTGGSSDNRNQGTVFELIPSAKVGFVERTLHAFTGGADGGFPHGALIQDNRGDLYGATPYGGTHEVGLVFRLHNDGTHWHETALYDFTGGDDKGGPDSNPVFDKAGNLYGTTLLSGGGVYELSPPTKDNEPGGLWTFTSLHLFNDVHRGAYPSGSVVLDRQGNLYGATAGGGRRDCMNGFGCGVIYKLSYNPGAAWPETILFEFSGHRDGADPVSPLLVGPGDTLYGATFGGGKDVGLIFELSK